MVGLLNEWRTVNDPDIPARRHRANGPVSYDSVRYRSDEPPFAPGSKRSRCSLARRSWRPTLHRGLDILRSQASPPPTDHDPQATTLGGTADLTVTGSHQRLCAGTTVSTNHAATHRPRLRLLRQVQKKIAPITDPPAPLGAPNQPGIGPWTPATQRPAQPNRCRQPPLSSWRASPPTHAHPIPNNRDTYGSIGGRSPSSVISSASQRPFRPADGRPLPRLPGPLRPEDPITGSTTATPTWHHSSTVTFARRSQRSAAATGWRVPGLPPASCRGGARRLQQDLGPAWIGPAHGHQIGPSAPTSPPPPAPPNETSRSSF
jgi:hypothetical protein